MGLFGWQLGRAFSGTACLRSALGMVLLPLAALAAAGCFGPPEGVLLLRDGAGGRVNAVERGDGMVMLEAVPDEGYAFAGWSCGQAAACPDGVDGLSSPRAAFEAGAELALKATFEPDSEPTTLVLVDAEGGTATADCGEQCTRSRGWAANVEAVPDEGHRFSAWECEGGEACLLFDLANPSLQVVVNGNITLTPRYNEAGGMPLTLGGVADGSLTVLADCGAGCAAGEGWNAVLSTTPLQDKIVRGWTCVEARACPRALEDAVTTVNFTVEDAITVAPELGSFGISSELTSVLELDFGAQALCSVEVNCIYLASGESDALSVAAPGGAALEYAWNVMLGAPHLSIEQAQGARATVLVAPELDRVTEGVVEVVSRGEGGVIVARSTIKVVAVPAALTAVLRFDLDNCLGDTGFVIRDGADYYVVAAYGGAHCYSGFSNKMSHSLTLGIKEPRRVLEGAAWGLDEITRVAVLRIPDPELAWVPRVAVGEHPDDEPLLLAGTSDTPLEEALLNFVVTEVEPGSSLDLCFSYYDPVESFATGPFPDGCEYDFRRFKLAHFHGLVGSAALNRDGEVAGLLSQRSRMLDEQIAGGTLTLIDGLDALAPLLQGGRRCTKFGTVINPDGTMVPMAITEVDDCSSRN